MTDHDHPDTDLTDHHGEAEALRKENARLRAALHELTQPTALRVLPTFTSANATDKAALAASRAPDPVVNAGICQPGDLISREAVLRIFPTIDDILHMSVQNAATFFSERRCKIRALPATPVAEAQPVAWQQRLSDGRWGTILHGNYQPIGESMPLYAHPPVQPIGGAELDALVARLRKLARDMDKDAPYDWDEHEDVTAAADTITALRENLALAVSLADERDALVAEISILNKLLIDWKAMAERLGEALGLLAIATGTQDAGGKVRAALSDLVKMRGE